MLILVACRGEEIEESVVASDVFPPEITDPIIYLYNAHPREMIGSSFADLSIGEMSVVELSHLLADHLESYGVSSLVELRCVTERLRANDWGFNRSYSAARHFLSDVIEWYPSLRLFIDLHRDGIAHYLASVDIDNRSYAQVLFVIGTDNPDGYRANYEVARTLHYMMEERRPGISRGIFLSGGAGRNGIYNQDLASTVQLIEVGTVETTVEEAMNTIEILAEVIAEFIHNEFVQQLDN